MARARCKYHERHLTERNDSRPGVSATEMPPLVLWVCTVKGLYIGGVCRFKDNETECTDRKEC